MSGVCECAKGAAPLTSARHFSSTPATASALWKHAKLSGERCFLSSRLNLAPAASSFVAILCSVHTCRAVLRTHEKRQHSGEDLVGLVHLGGPRSSRASHLPLAVTYST